MEEKIQEALVTREIFRFSIGRLNIVVTESMITMWIVMVALVIIAYIFSRNLKTIPDKKQNLVEMAIEFIGNMCKKTMGHYWKYFVPYIGTLAIFLSLSNMISIFNVIPTSKDLYNITHLEVFNKIPSYSITPPTRDINVAAGCALMTIVTIIFSTIYFKGFRGWIKTLCKPVAVMLPINILELAIKPMSLCLRLFGNILGAFIAMEITYSMLPILAPVIMSAYFDLFDGILQAYIFVFLSTIYIGDALED
ncbi:MAG: F0F1 ATP synthase subunit A [Clostridiales bacterium]|nr:F0F1 ATP synthase subunit A [Clostridiales bacterium]